MKNTGRQKKKNTPIMGRRWAVAIYDFHVRAFGEEMARVNRLPLAARRRYIGGMVDHAIQKGVKSTKPALGVSP
ncbi:MAG TPA: hypothetical protein VG754_00365 [Verrucomicrobiae bacterium]|jgi:hypothetical protein|nr:hypothetical protein [Verrucomicrobiae bacterium]